MANRRFFTPQIATVGTVFVNIVATGTATNPLTVSSDTKGVVATIARTGAGAYTVELSDKYSNLLGVYFGFLGAARAAYVVADTVATDGKFTIQVTDLAAAATDIAVNQELYMLVALRNSSAQGATS